MAYRFIEGDLFKSPDLIIAHGCNSHGYMGAGIARKIKEVYPKAYTRYKYLCEAVGLLPGDMVPVLIPEENGDKVVLNLITQNHPGPDARIEAIRTCLVKAVEYCDSIGEKSISIPAIGCGIGGLELSDLEGVLQGIDTDVMVTVYLLPETT